MYQKFFSKIARDLLIALIATYFILLIPELILPGIVSAHFNPRHLLIFILLLGLAYSRYGIRMKNYENPKFRAISRSLINIILFIITLMLILSLYKMEVWQITFVVAISIPLLITAENILIKEK